jgi:glycosyltransferase involved in cell wall biosynthesis
MNIGILLPGLGFAGGVERYAHDLSAALRLRGHRVALLYGPARGHDPEGFARGFDAAEPEERAASLGALDVVYAQKIKDPRALDGLGRTPVVLAAHDHDHTCPRSHRYLPIGHAPCHRSPGLGCALRGCAVVKAPAGSGRKLAIVDPFDVRARTRALAARAGFVACSRYVADRLEDAGVPCERVDVVHPIPPEDPRPIVSRPRQLRLLFVGQLLRGKGVEFAIDALARLPGEATLDIVGDGPSRPALEARAAHLGGRARFHGFRSPEIVNVFYDAASVVVVPSLWPEPFGMIGVEAMRRARPVVGAAHGGIPEWLAEGEGGALVPPGNVAALADAALRLHADVGAGARALAYAHERFRHEAFVDAIERVLERAARPASARPGLPASERRDGAYRRADRAERAPLIARST